MESKLPFIDVTQSLFKYIPYHHRKYFRGGHTILQFRDVMVQVLVVESVDDLLFKDSVKLFKVKQKSRVAINDSGDGDIYQIIVTVTIFIAALSVKT